MATFDNDLSSEDDLDNIDHNNVVDDKVNEGKNQEMKKILIIQFFMREDKFYPANIFLLILKDYDRPLACHDFSWTKFSFEGFLKISGQ